MRLILTLCAALLLQACAGRQSIVVTPPAACSKLIPDGWVAGVEATPIPDTQGLAALDQVKAWASAYVGMSGQLAKANGRTSDAIGIFGRCEAMVNGAR